jgi:hypothetical protein
MSVDKFYVAEYLFLMKITCNECSYIIEGVLIWLIQYWKNSLARNIEPQLDKNDFRFVFSPSCL